ncbi:MAG TPA: C45 family peptidase [Polyangiaceae bacterium]
MKRLLRLAKRAVLVASCVVLVLAVAHAAIRLTTRIAPPSVTAPAAVDPRDGVTIRAGLPLVTLAGTPEAIGAANARLVYAGMLDTEGQLWHDFGAHVPWWPLRAGIEDWALVRYRHVDRGIPPDRLRELAAQASAFDPDPWVSRMPTYQRMLFLHALYDVALPLEHSPVIGCSSLAFRAPPERGGHEIVARAFDFEAGEVFDREKVVYLVHEDGAVPFASVAWPGLVGVLTGMNAAGVFVAVHGGRAGQPTSDGMPVAFSLREVLARAHDTDEAVAVLSAQRPMVSHIVFVADGRGAIAVVERVPGEPAFARRSDGTGWVANAFEGPAAGDPKNLRVLATTTSAARDARLRELLGPGGPPRETVQDALAMLRDHKCAGGVACARGDRRSIDALIATHGVVADTTARVLYVSLGPHLSGRFVGIDLLAPDVPPTPATLPEDATLTAGGAP